MIVLWYASRTHDSPIIVRVTHTFPYGIPGIGFLNGATKNGLCLIIRFLW